ncbi:MAG TPA: cysteine desulfurase [Gemmatimonadaceae bacterium]|nr:cysteine desulfurase [Gemmatimonadaceae bacterium]
MTTAAARAAVGVTRPWDVDRIRADFPILATHPRGKPLVYLDSAATSQKPRVVIDALRRYYEEENGNIHRGVHYLSERATGLYDATREAVRRFICAARTEEIVFTRGTTEAVNLVAATFGQAFVRAGDEIVVSVMEHHSNLVPWQLLCERTGARLRAVPVTDTGELDLEAYESLLTPRTKLVALAWVSNALGTINPVERLVALARERGVPVLLDGAQAAPHIAIDVQAVGCDFLAFSGHKMLGPTGVGVLYARGDWLDRLPPWQGGGDMISSVSIDRSTWAPPPAKFEAGTPDIGAVAAFRAAIEYLEGMGLAAIAAHEHALLTYATARVHAIPGVRVIGTAPRKAGVLSFTLDGVHAHDVATILDQHGIAVRAGHHCAQPLMQRFGVPSTTRASFYLYNSVAEVDVLADAVASVRTLFA